MQHPSGTGKEGGENAKKRRPRKSKRIQKKKKVIKKKKHEMGGKFFTMNRGDSIMSRRRKGGEKGST